MTDTKMQKEQILNHVRGILSSAEYRNSTQTEQLISVILPRLYEDDEIFNRVKELHRVHKIVNNDLIRCMSALVKYLEEN